MMLAQSASTALSITHKIKIILPPKRVCNKRTVAGFIIIISKYCQSIASIMLLILLMAEWLRSDDRSILVVEENVCVSGMFLTRFRRGLTGKHIYMIAFLIPQAV
jgi:hypothetical protein